jgi:hypothetical protein
MKPAAPKPRLWPRWAVGPLGNRAIFHCAGDIPPKWKLETPLPGTEPEPALEFAPTEGVKDGDIITIAGVPGERVIRLLDPPKPKNKPGRPRKDAA